MGAKCRLEVLQNAPFCNTFDLHYAIVGLEKTNIFFVFLLSGLFRQVLLYTIKFNEYPICEVIKKNSDQPTHTGKTGLGKGKQKYF